MDDKTLLEIKDLHVWYKVYGGYLRVLQGVNFLVRRGERVGLVGEAGCGKTTTMKAILRILPEQDARVPRGEIVFRGKNILRMKRSGLHQVRSKGIAMIFQDPTAALNPVFTIGTQIQDAIRVAVGPGDRSDELAVRERAVKALKETYLPDQERLLGNYSIQLSGGMRQRACIAMAIATQRELLIADEPGTSLDVTIQDQILRLLKEIVEKKGTSIILITHSLGVAREMTDRIYVMYAGTIVETAPAGDLFKDPMHPYTRGLLASVPKITGGGIARGIPGGIPDYLNPPSGCRFHPRCEQASAVCMEKPPQLFEVGPDRSVACYSAQGVNR